MTSSVGMVVEREVEPDIEGRRVVRDMPYKYPLLTLSNWGLPSADGGRTRMRAWGRRKGRWKRSGWCKACKIGEWTGVADKSRCRRTEQREDPIVTKAVTVTVGFILQGHRRQIDEDVVRLVLVSIETSSAGEGQGNRPRPMRRSPSAPVHILPHMTLRLD